jgi:hypothetical protein
MKAVREGGTGAGTPPCQEEALHGRGERRGLLREDEGWLLQDLGLGALLHCGQTGQQWVGCRIQ